MPAAICHDKSSNAFFEASTSFADPPSKRSPAPLSASNNPMASLDSFRNVLDHASRHRNNLRHSKSHIVWCPRSTEATCNVVDTGNDEQSLKRACSLSEFSTLGVHLLESLQNHFTSQPDVTRGPSTNERLLVSLRATRSQLSRVSRSLREQSATNTSLRKELQAERAARFSAEKTLANITIGKKLFVEQVSSLSELTLDLQADTSIAVMNPESHMQTYSPATEISLRKVLQPYGASSASSPLMSDRTGPYDQRYSTLEDFDRPECSSLNHSLLKQRCETLSAKVSSLQANMMTCLDECAAALELERHLRYEVEGRLRVCEMQSLKCDMKPLEQTVASMEPPTNSSTESSDHFHQLNLITTASFGRCDALERENLEQRDIIRDLSQQLAGYAERVQKLTRENKKANIEHQKQWSKIFGNAPIGLTRIHQIKLIKEAVSSLYLWVFNIELTSLATLD